MQPQEPLQDGDVCMFTYSPTYRTYMVGWPDTTGNIKVLDILQYCRLQPKKAPLQDGDHDPTYRGIYGWLARYNRQHLST